MQFNEDLKTNYYKLIISYKNTFEKLNNLLNNPQNKDYARIAYNNYKEFMDLYSKTKNPEEYYVSVKNNIYKTKASDIQKAMDKIEIIIIKKYDKLLKSKKVSKENY
jgi:HD superfamily phosphohydrolase